MAADYHDIMKRATMTQLSNFLLHGEANEEELPPETDRAQRLDEGFARLGELVRLIGKNNDEAALSDYEQEMDELVMGLCELYFQLGLRSGAQFTFELSRPDHSLGEDE